MALTPKMQRFVDEYLVDLDGVAAYSRAGYKPKNRNCAAVESHRLRHRPDVAAAIEAAIDARKQRLVLTQDRVLLELARIAFADPRRLFGPDGKPLDISQLDDDTAAALVGVDVLDEFEGAGKDRQFIGHTKKYRMADKLGAITSAMRHLGMFKDRVEHTGAGGGPIKTEDVSMVDAARRIAFMMSAAVQELETKH